MQKISTPIRVTGLDEFSPFGWLFTLGIFLKIYRSCPNFKDLNYLKRYIVILASNWLGCILGIFSQTHLVTLTPIHLIQKRPPAKLYQTLEAGSRNSFYAYEEISKK
jgi:hypothetical protein